MPIDYSRFDKIHVSDSEGEEEDAKKLPDWAQEELARKRREEEQQKRKEKAKAATKTPEDKYADRTFKSEADREELAEDLGPLAKKFEAERIGDVGAKGFLYWFLEVLEAERQLDGRIKAKCDVEHKGQFDATQKHFVQTYFYDYKKQLVSLE